MLILVLLGVTLAANVVSWYNGKQTEKVQAEVAALEATRARILCADASARKSMVITYILDFRRLVQQELSSRNEVATSLTLSLQDARAIVKNRFGSQESDSFMQALREMELALGRLEAERAYLRFLLGTLPENSALVDLDRELPTPAHLMPPADFPCHGGLLDLSKGSPTQLHGYQLSYILPAQGETTSAHAMVVSVDHQAGTARVSGNAGMLLAASLEDGAHAIEATIVKRIPGHLELGYGGARLLLDMAGGHIKGKVGDRVTVYAGVWTLDSIAEQGRPAAPPLPVQALPRMNATRQVWSPIFLAFTEQLTDKLVAAYAQLDKQDILHEKWHIRLLDHARLGFSLGDITLVTCPDLDLNALRLEDIIQGPVVADPAVSFFAELNAFVPGTVDDRPAERTIFPQFVQVLYAELGSVRSMYLQRQSAVRLRKLSMIYEDQLDYLQSESACGFIAGKRLDNGAVEGTITIGSVPQWLLAATAENSQARLRATGSGLEWNVSRAEWINRRFGMLRLHLERPRKRDVPASPFLITRLELAGEGLQQQTFRNTLENAILGKFVSPSVHRLIMARGGSAIEHEHAGRDAALHLLQSDQPVIAIWGPPGTGKTTLLVNWLLSLFDADSEAVWPTILITGPTHVAVTKLTVDLLAKAAYLEREIVRYGRADNVEGTELAAMWHEALLAPFQNVAEPADPLDFLMQRWHRLLQTREGRENIAKWLLGPRHIHAASCVGMARRDFGLCRRDFDIVIIDEAGKAFDVELLIPAARARRLILIGDHYQLPPTVTAEMLSEKIGYRLALPEVEELLRRNCFQDLFEQLPVTSKAMLTVQHRMHKDIGDLVSGLFYKGSLSSSRQEPAWTLSTHRLTFIDFSAVPAYRHKKENEASSPRNPTELAAISSLLKRLSVTGMAAGLSVLVVCPYKGQREDVEQAIKRMTLNFSIAVSTVDAVQGGEANLVFLLMTRSGGRVEFLLDRNRLNVALSRARDAVYILGHQACLSPGGDGPVAALIQMGLAQQTLRVIRPRGRADHEKTARSLFPFTAEAPEV